MLEVRQLDAFYGDARALWGVNLDVRAGETVCVIGPNGAGKSTLVNAIARLHSRTRGRIAVDGTDVCGVATHQVCSCGVAIVPEGRRVFAHMTVHDNLCLGAYRPAARKTYKEQLERAYQLFPRLAERSGQLAGTLSGGEQQMVAIARALMARPRLLLLDEPSLGLAPLVTREIFRIVRTINQEQGVSVLLVEQNASMALELADHAYLLETGRVVMSGPSAVLKRDDSIRRSYLGY